MTAFIRPSLILCMDLDSRLYSDEAVADIKRSYSYVAPSVVQSHEPADETRVENVLRFRIIMHRAYWDKNDAAAQELWANVMPKWLHNMFYKVSNTITASNKVHTERGEATSDYAWLELEFGENALMAIKTQSDSSFPDAAEDMVEQVRDLYAAGTLGEGVACVRIPSRESYEAQLAAAEEEAARAAAEAAEQARIEAEAKAAVAGEAYAAEQGEALAGLEAQAAQMAADDDLVVQTLAEAGEEAREEEAAAAGDAAADTAEANTTDTDAGETAEEQAFVAPKLPAFDIDYRTWGIEYADGSVRAFDSETGAFQE